MTKKDQEALANSQFYRSLRRSMMTNVLVVSFAPMLLISAIYVYHFHKAYKEKVHDYLMELVLKHEQEIDGFLQDKLGMVRFLSKSVPFEDLADENSLHDVLNALQQESGPFFVDLGLVDAEGDQVSYAGPFNLRGATYAEADWYVSAMKSRVYISDVFLGLRGLPHFIVAVKRTWEGREWILRATVDFNLFNQLVENLRVGETGFAYILNIKGEFQTKPMYDVDLDQALFNRLLAAGEASESKAHIFKAEDQDGQESLYAVATLKSGEWLLVYQQRTADAFRHLSTTRNLSILVLAVGGLAIVAMVAWISRRTVSHIMRSDFEKEKINDQMIEASKLASIGELAAGIAHEINNPVAIMVEEAGWIEDLLADGMKGEDDPKELTRALEQIRIQGLRCKEITHKLLHFARRTDSRREELNINRVVEELVELMEQRAKYSKVAITTNLATGLPAVFGSGSEVQQVLLNLINNSLYALEAKGGIIRVRTSLDRSPKATAVVIEVTDDGPGIPQANLKKIFDPFFTTKPVGKGTGLGLSICYGIVKKMGGDIEVDSVVGEGTSFRITLPAELSDTEQPGGKG